jgi:hypothetical protein
VWIQIGAKSELEAAARPAFALEGLAEQQPAEGQAGAVAVDLNLRRYFATKGRQSARAQSGW